MNGNTKEHQQHHGMAGAVDGGTHPTSRGISLLTEVNAQQLTREDELTDIISIGGRVTNTSMCKELENLILEYNERCATKKALNVKDDLIAKIDILTSEQDVLREEIVIHNSVRKKLQDRIVHLEDELKKLKEDLEVKTREPTEKEEEEGDVPMAQRKRFTPKEMAQILTVQDRIAHQEDELKKLRKDLEVKTREPTEKEEEEGDVPMAQRKRFTRVEMCRVLMERNQYKEQAIELQKMIRGIQLVHASKENPGEQETKRKPSVWKFFDNLFRSSHEPGKPRYRYSAVPVKKDNGSMQAYGWSLPTKFTTNFKDTDRFQVPIPVPVYMRPLFDSDTDFKIRCAAGVNLTGLKSQDGDSAVKFSLSPPEPSLENQQEGDNPHQELKDQELRGSCDVEQMSSLVWVCTANHDSSQVSVIDANNPADILETFSVSVSHILCIASVPGDDSHWAVSSSELPEPRVVQAEGSPAASALPASSLTPATGVSSPPSDLNDNGSSLLSEESEVLSDSMHKLSSVLPTMWMGTQDGSIYVHSSVSDWRRCIHSVKLRDSVLAIVHVKGRVLASLSDGTIAVFHRATDGQWDLVSYHLIVAVQAKESVCCMTVVDGQRVWCGYKNKIHIVCPLSMIIQKTFDAHPRNESVVSQLCWVGDGVWVSIHLDSTLRLYHAYTHQHLQDIDVKPCVSKMIGVGLRKQFMFVGVTAMMISCNRLWIGTNNGVIMFIPLPENNKQPMTATSTSTDSDSQPGGDTSMKSFPPYISFHGHKDAVTFFAAVPGIQRQRLKAGSQPPPSTLPPRGEAVPAPPSNSRLILAGGEGYVDFRVGVVDDGDAVSLEDSTQDTNKVMALTRSDSSHIIVWQVSQE